MKLYAFTVYDSKVAAYLPPFFMRSVGEAVRSFSDTVNHKESAFNKHPADYVLFQIGSFDDSKGIYEATTHVNLGVAIEFLDKEVKS